MSDALSLAAKEEKLTGTVSQLYYQRPDFCTGKIRNRYNESKFSIKGFVSLNQKVTLVGKWTIHPKFGRQFESSDIVMELPADAKGMREWLSKSVDGVGPATADKLVERYGVELGNRCSSDPQAVADECGLDLSVTSFIGNEWSNCASTITVKTHLAGCGLTWHQVELIVARYKSTAIDVIKRNPYELLGNIDGMGFKTIDEIAKKMGIEEDDPRRVSAAVFWSVKSSHNESGHTAVPVALAMMKGNEFLENKDSHLEPVIRKLIEDKAIKHIVGVDGNEYVAFPSVHEDERRILEFLRAAKGQKVFTFKNPIQEGDEVKVGNNTLDELQSKAVVASQHHRVSVIVGGAGCGKSTLVKAIHQHYVASGIPVYMAAPTGKAAKRLAEVVGSEAVTIHRLLEYNPVAGFGRNEMEPLPSGLFIIDEVSMVSSDLMADLIRALPAKSALILVGDPNQLPSVGYGSVLRDVCESGIVNVTRLEKCHRQAGTLKINCSAVLEGRVNPTDTENEVPAWIVNGQCGEFEQFKKSFTNLFMNKLKDWGYDPLIDTQIMTAMHAGQYGTKFLNRYCQWLYQNSIGVYLNEPEIEDERKGKLMVGDKVIHTKNNYNIGVMNGAIGTLVKMSPFTVEYEGREVEYPPGDVKQVELGYVLSVHKNQGSEFPCAVVVMPKAHFRMHSRNWFYTAVTRAKKTAIIIGDGDPIRWAAGKVETETRITLMQIWSKCSEDGHEDEMQI